MTFMRRLTELTIAFALALCAQTAAARAEVMEHANYPSARLARAMGYSLCLPDGWREARSRFPVLYLLHGRGDDDATWLRQGRVAETAARMMANGRIAPLIIAMPDAALSWYVDSHDVGGPGAYGSAIAEEFVAMMEAQYPVRAERGARAVAGLSMGGYGALRFAFARPDRFAAVVAMSPALWSRVTPETAPDERHARVFVGSFGQPFNSARFVAANPFGMIPALARSAQVPAILLMAGNDDIANIVADTRLLHQRLGESGIAAELRMSEGRHDWGYWSAKVEEMLLFVDAEFRRSRERGVRSAR
jgi:enterochelin esterase family protein